MHIHTASTVAHLRHGAFRCHQAPAKMPPGTGAPLCGSRVFPAAGVDRIPLQPGPTTRPRHSATPLTLCIHACQPPQWGLPRVSPACLTSAQPTTRVLQPTCVQPIWHMHACMRSNKVHTTTLHCLDCAHTAVPHAGGGGGGGAPPCGGGGGGGAPPARQASGSCLSGASHRTGGGGPEPRVEHRGGQHRRCLAARACQTDN